MATLSKYVRSCLITGLLLASPVLRAQHPGPDGGGPPQGDRPPGPPPGPPPEGNQGRNGPPHPGGPRPHVDGAPPPSTSDTAGGVSTMRGGLQLGPPGRWWDDRDFANSLGLRTEQQRRMDAIFEQNRLKLLKLYQSYQLEQSNLESLTHAKPLDESALMTEIDRVGHARILLEQANTHMLLQIRGQMSPDQVNRLDSHR